MKLNLLNNYYKLIANLKNSIRGIWFGLNGHSFRLVLLFGICLLVVLFCVEKSLWNKYLAVVAYFILLAFELMNTAIEAVCDRITKDFDVEIKNIKDTASAAVLVVFILNLIMLVSFL